MRALGAKPAPFADWNGTSTVLLDVIAKKAQDLGPGSPGQFSPDGTRMAWIRGDQPTVGGEAVVLNLATGVETTFGPGRIVAFVDDRTLGIVPPGQNTTQIVDLTTGTRRTENGIAILQLPDELATPDGFLLRTEPLSDAQQTRMTFRLFDPGRGEELLSFEAWKAVPAGRGFLAVATVPKPVAGGLIDQHGNFPQTTNIFLVHVATGQAVFVATASAYPPNWPLIADDRYVIWTEDYCTFPPGKTRIFDRKKQRTTETDATLWLDGFTPDGLIASGAFGTDELIDPETLQYTAVIPPSEATWSTDYRYASVGQVGGHGGLCL
jgi:hypothetical protein